MASNEVRVEIIAAKDSTVAGSSVVDVDIGVIIENSLEFRASAA